LTPNFGEGTIRKRSSFVIEEILDRGAEGRVQGNQAMADVTAGSLIGSISNERGDQQKAIKRDPVLERKFTA